MKLDKAYVEQVFRDYTSAYNDKDPKIRLKIDHTYRVASLCETIAADIGADNPELAWLMGMLHDIGRFEQVRRFHTFNDSVSVNHAALGADLLFQDGLLETFVPRSEEQMSQEELRILELAIRNHGTFRIQEGLNAKEAMYCHILRDADKIDIFRVNWDTPLEDIYNVTTEELRAGVVSGEVKQCFDQHTAVLRSLTKTAVDHVVGHICLTFELVYPVSRRLAKEQGYVDKLLEFSSDNSDTAAWFSYMKEHLWEAV